MLRGNISVLDKIISDFRICLYHQLWQALVYNIPLLNMFGNALMISITIHELPDITSNPDRPHSSSWKVSLGLSATHLHEVADVHLSNKEL